MNKVNVIDVVSVVVVVVVIVIVIVTWRVVWPVVDVEHPLNGDEPSEDVDEGDERGRGRKTFDDVRRIVASSHLKRELIVTRPLNYGKDTF